MGNDLIGEDTAKAIQETAKFGGKLVDASSAAGGYLSNTLGSLPENLVGLIGDQVAYWRRRRWIDLSADLERRLGDRGVKGVEPSPTLAIPILQAAVDETREALKELWARLLANAFDPNRTHLVRSSFIELLKKFDPMDAVVFEVMASQTGDLSPNARDFVVAKLGSRSSLEEVLVSFENLEQLGCISRMNRDAWNPIITNRGKLLYRALTK
ncbi:Abi-alpha family protein [Bradyrhizobium sp. HKCCYLRH3083]|uniref:Abi-alpha family protein n=1 Tax=unclassified Bradyrhizobium TaxID=2631580 RepID=UPI003EBFEE99